MFFKKTNSTKVILFVTTTYTEPVNCGTPNLPANGQVAYNGTVFESTANYSCDMGFKLIGNVTRVCQADGTWSDSPTCISMCKTNMIIFTVRFVAIIIIVDCGPLEDPANGNVILTNTLLRSTATYTCDFGYSLVGEDFVVCQANAAGSWSGSATCSGIMFCVLS